MMNFGLAGTKLTRTLGRLKLGAMKKAPYIMTGVGIVGVGVGVVWACKATLKVDSIVTKAEKQLRNVDKAYEASEVARDYSYTKEDRNKDVTIIRAQEVAELGRLYLPPTAILTLSVACLVGGQVILHKRFVGAVAAFEGVSKAFDAYRKNVIEELGPNADFRYKWGIKAENFKALEKSDEDSDELMETQARIENQVEDFINGCGESSPYARIFDELNPNYNECNPDLNRFFMIQQQRNLNHLLDRNGYVFLNDAYDCLGMPKSPAGQIVGWVKGNKDSVIDFDVIELFDDEGRVSYVVDFNVDGNVYQYLGDDGRMHMPRK